MSAFLDLETALWSPGLEGDARLFFLIYLHYAYFLFIVISLTIYILSCCLNEGKIYKHDAARASCVSVVWFMEVTEGLPVALF